MPRRFKQPPLFPLPLPETVVVVQTTDLDIATAAGAAAMVDRMLAVPPDRSILLDFLVGYQRGQALADEQLEAYRLQMLLNSRYHGRRLNFLGSSLAAQLLRESIRTESWNPFKTGGRAKSEPKT